MNLALLISLGVIIVAGILYLIFRQWKRPSTRQYYLCLDGHTVKSRGEWMIDATLQFLGIPHQYEVPLQISGKKLHPDFCLGHDIYIEYWGLTSYQYKKFKRLKMRLYKRARVHLINIENEDLHNLTHVLLNQLTPFRQHFSLNQTIN